MCIKDYETEIGGQGPVRAVELLEKKVKISLLQAMEAHRVARG
jgi:hypothetical protein